MSNINIIMIEIKKINERMDTLKVTLESLLFKIEKLEQKQLELEKRLGGHI